jgi:hypothetical protein
MRYIYIPRANQIFTKIDKLPSNANTMAHWYSAGVVQSLHGRGVCRVRWSDIHLYIHTCTHIILYNDVCRTIGPQTAVEGGQDNNNALIRSWVLVIVFSE